MLQNVLRRPHPSDLPANETLRTGLKTPEPSGTAFETSVANVLIKYARYATNAFSNQLPMRGGAAIRTGRLIILVRIAGRLFPMALGVISSGGRRRVNRGK